MTFANFKTIETPLGECSVEYNGSDPEVRFIEGADGIVKRVTSEHPNWRCRLPTGDWVIPRSKYLSYSDTAMSRLGDLLMNQKFPTA